MSSRDIDRSLELARAVFAPSAQHRERVFARLAAAGALGSEVGSRGAASPVAAPRSTRWLGTRWLGMVKAGLFVGAGFTLGYWFAETRAQHERIALVSAPALDPPENGPREAPATEGLGASAHRAAPSPTSADASNLAPRELAAPREPAARQEPTVSASRASRSRRDPPRGRAAPPIHRPATTTTDVGAQRFAEELLLLQRAERAIRAGDGPLARSFIADLEARFPRTALRQERAAVLVLADCAAHEPEAADSARGFVARHPNSVYLDRIRMACALEPSPEVARDVPGDTPRETPSASPPDGSPSRGH